MEEFIYRKKMEVEISVYIIACRDHSSVHHIPPAKHVSSLRYTCLKFMGQPVVYTTSKSIHQYFAGFIGCTGSTYNSQVSAKLIPELSLMNCHHTITYVYINV